MKSKLAILFGSLSLMASQTNADEELGIIGKKYEDGLPVIYKFVNDLPEKEVQANLTWLTVISWKYDGSINNGMPSETDNGNMIRLEDAIDKSLDGSQIARHAYSRTGNSIKEFVYYINSREKFMTVFNRALEDHPRYPLEINFYEDESWEDFSNLLNNFSNAVNK